jgi:hypothetical protein
VISLETAWHREADASKFAMACATDLITHVRLSPVVINSHARMTGRAMFMDPLTGAQVIIRLTWKAGDDDQPEQWVNLNAAHVRLRDGLADYNTLLSGVHRGSRTDYLQAIAAVYVICQEAEKVCIAEDPDAGDAWGMLPGAWHLVEELNELAAAAALSVGQA